ncbi:DUF481 domain-containing protein [Aliidiomarina minuta]|uniref:DUF481 domain-containing protein n=1 Tax=Aliidiomarina minuta TaxID=880057 RepID=A0A432W492_9GAMM|nr:DUF481 domain-containing protein [Aliidiomarina minuta]RUO24322.1 DUF481 domain-containing protein [Aliidiomarina minuta]
MRKTLLSAVVLGLLTPAASATTFMFDDIQDIDPENADSSWRATAEVGLLMRTGNTESQSWKGKLNLERDSMMWRHRGEVDYYQQKRETFEGDNVTEADRLFMSAQSNRRFEEGSASSFFGYLSYEDDRLSSYEYQTTVAAGYGTRYVHNPDIYADFEVGPGYSWDRRRDTNETEGELTVRLAAALNWDLSETARFTQTVSTELGDENTRSRSVSALTSNINSRLAIRVSLTLTHNSTVYEQADGRVPEKLDTETAATLVYTFLTVGNC